MTIADFPMYDAIKWHRTLDKDLIGAFSNLAAFIDRFESEPKIKTFLAGEKAYKSYFFPIATPNVQGQS